MAASSAAAAYEMTAASNWWDDVNASAVWQDRIFHALAALYAVVAAVALVIPPSPAPPLAFAFLLLFFSRIRFVGSSRN